MPIEAIAAVGPDWNIANTAGVGQTSAPLDIGTDGTSLDGVSGVGGAGGSNGGGFGDMLAGQIDNLQGMQTEAAAQSQALATGQAQDISQVTMAVEKAQLSMQLAANLRDKGVESFQEIFRTQV
jgi:flagellar hook-basal body complex protein FliE